MRILNVLTYIGGKIIGLGSDNKLHWCNAQHPDAFQALKIATLNPAVPHWRPFQVGADADVAEPTEQYLQDAQTRHGFPYRPKTLQPV
jgi:hypothetical protein